MINFIVRFLLYLWQLPQNLLGLCLTWYYSLGKFPKNRLLLKYKRDVWCVETHILRSPKMEGGITLGQYVIVSDYSGQPTIDHECGHVKQSIILGPFYLLLIGVQSIIHAAVHKNLCHSKNYVHFWTEKWADVLGGVKRN